MTADLSALIARLEAAEVGSHELDKAVAIACGSSIQVWAETASDGTFLGSVRAYTTSLDAALALAERVLPGKEWMLVKSTEGGETSFHALIGPDSLGRAGEAASAALALCIAILRAKQGEGG